MRSRRGWVLPGVPGPGVPAARSRRNGEQPETGTAWDRHGQRRAQPGTGTARDGHSLGRARPRTGMAPDGPLAGTGHGPARPTGRDGPRPRTAHWPRRATAPHGPLAETGHWPPPARRAGARCPRGAKLPRSGVGAPPVPPPGPGAEPRFREGAGWGTARRRRSRPRPAPAPAPCAPTTKGRPPVSREPALVACRRLRARRATARRQLSSSSIRKPRIGAGACCIGCGACGRTGAIGWVIAGDICC